MAVENETLVSASQANEIKEFLEQISQELNAYDGPERRSESRQRIVVPVLLMPFTSNGEQAGEAIHGITRDLSSTGIGLLTTRPIVSDKTALLFQTLNCDELLVVLQLTRCRRVGYYYDIGGQFVGTLRNSPV